MTLMRAVMLVAALAVMLPLSAAPAPAQAANCEFVLGFKAIHDMIPDKVGDCQNNEYHGSNGDGLQNTTAWHGKGGLLAWRKADNWTAFTDGANSWVNGPNGLQQRTNDTRFRWEANPENLPWVGEGPQPTVQPATPTTGPNQPTATPPPQPAVATGLPAGVVPVWHEDAEKKFQYPKGWLPGRCAGGGCYGYIEPNGRAIIRFYAPMRLGAGYNLPELAIDWQHRNADKKSLTIGALEQPVINGFPTIIQGYEYSNDDGSKTKGLIFASKNGALVYEVDYYCSGSRWAEFEPTFRWSLSTFVPKSGG